MRGNEVARRNEGPPLRPAADTRPRRSAGAGGGGASTGAGPGRGRYGIVYPSGASAALLGCSILTAPALRLPASGVGAPAALWPPVPSPPGPFLEATSRRRPSPPASPLPPRSRQPSREAALRPTSRQLPTCSPRPPTLLVLPLTLESKPFVRFSSIFSHSGRGSTPMPMPCTEHRPVRYDAPCTVIRTGSLAQTNQRALAAGSFVNL